LRTFSFPWEAQLVQARLAAEGIESRIGDENLIRMHGALSTLVGGVKLLVWEEDAARAEAVLESAQPLPEIYLVTEDDATQPRCPGCRSENIASERWLLRRRWRCRRCGAAWRDDDWKVAEPEGTAVDLVTVARFPTPWEAHLARTRLESEGIEACVMEERLPLVDLFSGELRALSRVEVHPEDAELAIEILGQLDEASSTP
jgi:ribosomal protein L37AE/L43A